MPEAQRKAVTMLKLEEKSLAETSALTGISVTALKVSTHRALNSLRKLLEKCRAAFAEGKASFAQAEAPAARPTRKAPAKKAATRPAKKAATKKTASRAKKA